MAEAQQLGFTGTPAIVLGTVVGSTVTVTHRIKGSRPLDDFIVAIDDLLKRLN